jgi:acetyl-CoA synthetase
MLEQYMSRVQFDSYEDFKEHCEILVPERFNFAYDIVDRWAAEAPDKLALVWTDETGAKAAFTFGEMKRESDRMANVLRNLGIGKGDPVMLILKRRYEFWFCVIALCKLGAIAIPATHLLTKKDIAYRNNAASVKMIIAVNEDRVIDAVDAAEADSPTLMRKVVLGQREGWMSYGQLMECTPADFTPPSGAEASANDDIMLMYFTSGTTGMPKMVMHDFSYPLGHILTASYWQQVEDGGIHLTVADTGWAKAAWGKLYGQWIAGAAVMVYDYERFVPKAMMDVVAGFKLTSFCAPPTVFRFLIKEDLSGYDLSNLKHCITAGEPLNPEVYNAWLRATGHPLIEGYGQTETVILAANYPWLTPRPGSMGKPTPMYDVDIVNDKGESCEVGEEGQIVIHTAAGKPIGMFSGYYRDEALTNSVWHDGLYYTGDMAWRDEDGFFWFVGRADDLIKTSGYRVGPFEVESALLEHPAVMECAVTGIPDPVRGQVIKATVVLTKAYTAGDDLVTELQEHVRKVTAPYKYPRIIEFVPELPKTISGKIRRVQIREEDKDKEIAGQ